MYFTSSQRQGVYFTAFYHFSRVSSRYFRVPNTMPGSRKSAKLVRAPFLDPSWILSLADNDTPSPNDGTAPKSKDIEAPVTHGEQQQDPVHGNDEPPPSSPPPRENEAKPSLRDEIAAIPLPAPRPQTKKRYTTQHQPGWVLGEEAGGYTTGTSMRPSTSARKATDARPNARPIAHPSVFSRRPASPRRGGDAPPIPPTTSHTYSPSFLPDEAASAPNS